ncbi:MAG: hypothetical protein P1V81_12930 [Planctomycetota bacterium]|nr:hypothetical protein [Planctomycetota bacterium]
MNASLRRRHRGVVLGLALVLPLGFVAAVAARPVPPGPLLEARIDAAVGALLVGKGELEGVRILHGLEATERGLELRLQALDELDTPDVLAYWCPADGQGLAAGAYLLGGLHGLDAWRYVLPARAARPSEQGTEVAGRLVLYSLAHAQVVLEAELRGVAVER